MEQIHWNNLKQLAISNNLVASIQYLKRNDTYYVWLAINANTYLAVFKVGTDAAIDFETNYVKNIVSNLDDYGKAYVTLYSGNQGLDTVIYTTRGDTIDTIGGGQSALVDDSSFTYNADSNDSVSTTYIQFNSDYRILGGTLFWENGSMDCYGDCYIILPKGAPIGMGEDGTIVLAPVDIPVSHFVIEQRLPGTNNMGLPIRGERATDSIPSYLAVKIIWHKPVDITDFKAFIQFSIYREDSV